MDLFVKKSAEDLLHEADNEGGRGLKRVLGPWGLIALGVGVIIGAGLFSVTGIVAGEHTGPAIVISFALAAIACAWQVFATQNLRQCFPCQARHTPIHTLPWASLWLGLSVGTSCSNTPWLQ